MQSGKYILKILVTGGAGFIGSALIRELLKNTNYEVVNVDALRYAGNLNSLPFAENNKNYYFELCDICDEDQLKIIFKKYEPNVIFHLAAESHVDRSILSPKQFIETNIMGTFNLLNLSLDLWNSRKSESNYFFRFHHISTDEVFGDLGDSELKFQESSLYRPSSPYAASKASSDHLVRSWGRTYGLPYILTNCSNNYGPYQFPEKLIPQTILNAINGSDIPIYGDGNQIRDWLYVDDHVQALLCAVFQAEQNQNYNIGGNNEIKNIDVVNQICKILDNEVKEKPQSISSFADLISYVTDRPGHDLKYAIDASKIHKELGWTPNDNFETGIKKTVLWYLDNQVWWKQILQGTYQEEKK